MRIIAATWGITGITLLIGCAIYRLAPKAQEAIQADLSLFQWIFLVSFALFMLVCEGYRGFQKKFSPRTAARIRYLYQNPTPLHTLLAPLFCMGYFYATKKTKIISTCLTLGIFLLVISMRFCPDPWRGIIDVGVVLGLSYGLISFFAFTIQALTKSDFPHSPETPH